MVRPGTTRIEPAQSTGGGEGKTWLPRRHGGADVLRKSWRNYFFPRAKETAEGPKGSKIEAAEVLAGRIRKDTDTEGQGQDGMNRVRTSGRERRPKRD